MQRENKKKKLGSGARLAELGPAARALDETIRISKKERKKELYQAFAKRD
jgi:hypothetical protein